MTEALYLNDHYLKEFDAIITRIESPSKLVLNRTALYPKSGGQPSDHGWILLGNTRLEVIDSFKSENDEGAIVHQISGGIEADQLSSALGSAVRGIVDWDLRYTYMRYHTALHILSGVVYQRFGSRITGGQIYSDRARLDFTLNNLDKEKIDLIEREINRVVGEDHEVRTFWISAEEARARSDLYRLNADLLPRGLDKLRVVDIVGFDAQLDGGTHVRRTGEVGRVRISKTENKGKENKRIEIVLSGTV